MTKIWDEASIQLYIDDEIEESLNLDYKAAEALAKTDGKKKEITKDVSAMANSDGGIIIYGLKEHTVPAKKHLPELIDPIDRTVISKEWLEHVINNISPRISGIIIHSVNLSSSPDNVAYVVKIPRSATAHQATDLRYYKRFNFESVAMYDYEVRDVMNRAIRPNASIEFKFKERLRSKEKHEYQLQPIIKNLGEQVINNFKLTFSFPKLTSPRHLPIRPRENLGYSIKNDEYFVDFQSKTVLFPNEDRDLSDEIGYEYEVDSAVFAELSILEAKGMEPIIRWTLYADNMIPKSGEVPFSTLNNY